MNPLVSVLIVTYNYGRFLGECIESVLQQNIPGTMEIIVVDDGSDDDTRTVAGRYPVKYVRQEHKGIAAARNTAIAQAKGQWIAFIDADDLWTPDKLALQLKKAEENPDAEIIFCPVKNCTVNETALLMQKERGCPLTENVRCFLTPALIRRPLLLRLGGFPEDMVRGEDTYVLLKMRMERVDCGICIDKACYLRRVHGENITLSGNRSEQTENAVLTRLLREKILSRRKEKSKSAGRTEKKTEKA